VSTSDSHARGLAAGLAAYLWWGLAPLYFHALAAVPPLEILAHRVVWSVAFLALVLSIAGRWAQVREALSSARRVAALAASTALISTNWGIFIWAISRERLLEASLGYFINPLVNVALGALVLREPLGRRQLAALSLAALGVALLVARVGAFPWIALALALTFGFYALVRKRARADALAGLLVETALLAPLALGFLVARGAAGAFGHALGPSALLAAAGVVTAVPLVLFGVAVRHLRLSSMGVLQYVAPTCQFLLAVLVFDEPFGAAQASAFALIWIALALYTADAIGRTHAIESGARSGSSRPGGAYGK
jgi:chloramphenicol-sensitive protein RarD